MHWVLHGLVLWSGVPDQGMGGSQGGVQKDQERVHSDKTNTNETSTVGVSICRLNGNVYGDGEYRKLKKTHFMVKVQIPLDNAAFPLFIYNEDRSISGELCKEGNEEIHGELSRRIRSVGIGKGYFRAFLDKEKQLKINPLRSQPLESW